MAPHCSEIGDQSVSWLTRGDIFWKWPHYRFLSAPCRGVAGSTCISGIPHCLSISAYAPNAAAARQAQAPALGRCPARLSYDSLGRVQVLSSAQAPLAPRGSPR